MIIGPYKVKWEHNRIDGMQTNTVCTITDTSFVDSVIVAVGCSYLHPQDHFSKNVGRKISLAKALKKWAVDKRMRKQVWQAYFQMRNGRW